MSSAIREQPVSGEKVNASGTEHVARMDGVLARVFRRNGYEGVTTRTPLSELLYKEEGPGADDIVQEARTETLRKMLRYIFEEGPQPYFAMRRLYAIARAIDPEWIAQMNGTDLAELFDETRANQSARLKKMFDRILSEGSESGTAKLPCQKPQSARLKMAKSQQGNQNRKGKKIAQLAKASSRKYHTS